jgi:methylated-DNA-[protein]-cysteine S-methyltransferase
MGAAYDLLEIPTGVALVAARDGHLTRLDHVDRERAAEHLAELLARRGLADARHDPGAAPLPAVREQLAQYFAGKRQVFELPLAPVGTEFDQAVWALLRAIPYGETRSYGQLARALSKPGSFRAVGRANGRNPIGIIVPCHRVIGSDGSLTGFAAGLPAKRLLLELERAICETPLQQALPGF